MTADTGQPQDRDERTGATEADIERRLVQKYLREQTGYALLRQVTIEDAVAMDEYRRLYAVRDWRTPLTDEQRTARDSTKYRRIDALLIKTSASAKPVPFERMAIEIKVTRADFRRDTATKRRAWTAVCHRFAYCTPKGLIAPDEVPDGCGLMEVDYDQSGPWSHIEWRVKAPRHTHTPAPMGDQFMAYLAGRAARAEAAVATAYLAAPVSAGEPTQEGRNE